MKRYQEIEFTRHCRNTKSFLKKLQVKHPKFFEVWGEGIEYNFNQGIEYNIDYDCGYILHTIHLHINHEEDLYHVHFIAINKKQVIE